MMELNLATEKEDALAVRRSVLCSLFDTGGGHYGGSLSVVDILLVLARDVIRLSRNNADSPGRDRLILSKGHAAVALYSVLHLMGVLQNSALAQYGAYASGLEGHPDMLATKGIDFSTGSLGQGISAGAGMAIVFRRNGPHAWVVMGDGECQEGQVWEAAMFASRYRLSNLHVVIDSNGAQEIGWRHDPSMPQEPIEKLAEKWRSFGWIVHEVDGHDQQILKGVLLSLREEDRAPSVVIAHTRKGKGVKRIENDPIRYHCLTVDNIEHEELLAALYA
jgi:transketolase